MPHSRRDWLKAAAGGAAALFLGNGFLARDLFAATPARMTLYKSPTCGCCTKWVEHVRKAGFTVDAKDLDDARMQEVKASLGVPAELQSCHTGLVGGYAIEGHVPADVIAKALREKPAGTLLTVPGMPMGSPGMEMGARRDRFDVVLYDRTTRRSRVYASR
ncbi:MAG TPA: DUF411 domain-containing protein [Gemmatimonadaceae bacterium]